MGEIYFKGTMMGKISMLIEQFENESVNIIHEALLVGLEELSRR